WAAEADAFDRKCEGHRAEMRREVRDAERERAAGWAEYVNALVERRLGEALAERQHEMTELARSTVEFANAVDKRLVELERLLTKRGTAHRAIDDLRRGDIIDMPSPLTYKQRIN